MSYTTLHIIDADGDVCDDSEYGNSWGFAAMIWEALLRRYRSSIPGATSEGSFNDWPKLWKAHGDGLLDLQPWESDALSATYDHAMIRGSDLEKLAVSLDRFHDVHADSNRVCSLRAIAKRLRQLANGEQTKIKAPDVCFTATSVAADSWLIFEDDEKRPYNVKKDTAHWYVDLAAPAAPDGTPPGREP